MMFQEQPVDLSRQLQGLNLKDAAGLPPDLHCQHTSEPWAGQERQGLQASHGSTDGKEAGLTLLKMLQAGGQDSSGHPQQQQLVQHGSQETGAPILAPYPLPIHNGPAPSMPQPQHQPGKGLFGPPQAADLGAGGQPALTSLFAGGSIWSTTSQSSSEGGNAPASSLWGGASIWSSQQESWPAQQPLLAPPSQQAQQLPIQYHPSQLPPNLGAAPTSMSFPLASPRHTLAGMPPAPSHPHHHHHQHQQQQPPQHAHPGFPSHPPAPYNPPHSLHPALTLQQAHLPSHLPTPSTAHHPPPLGLSFGGAQHAPYHSQPSLLSGVQQMFPAELQAGLLGLGGGPPGGLHLPHPPPPQPHVDAVLSLKLASLAQQQQQQQQAQQRLALGEQQLQLPPMAASHQLLGAAGGGRGEAQVLGLKAVRPQQQVKQAQGQQPNQVAAAATAQAGSTRENSRWVEVTERGSAARLPARDWERLDARLLELANSLAPTPEEQQRQRAAFERVREVLLRRWPQARVHLFGSVANGLSVRSSNDLDVCLELADVGGDQAAKGELATEVGEMLQQAGMAEVLPLPKARVPVVKFVVPEGGTKVDITVNNMLACINTKLLADYAAVDPRLAQLVAVVKYWAKQRSVNDSYRGTLSSYCYVLMCIHLLQTRSPPVLPSLQQMPPTFRAEVGKWKCEFFDQMDSLRDFGCDNHEGLGQLVWAFFEYWAWRHDYASDVISVRTGGFLRKEDKDWTRRIGNERHLVCIEDPFELSHDLGRTVDRQTKSVLHKEFIRAARLLRDAQDPLDQLFQPYRAGKP